VSCCNNSAGYFISGAESSRAGGVAGAREIAEEGFLGRRKLAG